jgi:hypothetical protein
VFFGQIFYERRHFFGDLLTLLHQSRDGVTHAKEHRRAVQHLGRQLAISLDFRHLKRIE